MEVIIKRSKSTYSSREAALNALSALTFESGLLVSATYTETTDSGSETKVILAVGIASGIGQYKVIASFSDIVDVVEAISAVSQGLQDHSGTMASGQTSGHVVNSTDSDIEFTDGVGVIKSEVLDLSNFAKIGQSGIVGIKASSVSSGTAQYANLTWAEVISEIEGAGSVGIATKSGQPIVLSGKAGDISVSISDSIVLPGNPSIGKSVAVDGDLDIEGGLAVANVDYVRKKIAAIIAAADAMSYKGTLDPTTTSLPAANAGDTWTISANSDTTTDKTGLGVLHIGDLLICKSDNTAASTTSEWDVVETHKDTIFGPASSVSGDLPIFDGTSGKVVKDSGISIDNVVLDSRKVLAGSGLELNSTNTAGTLDKDVKIEHSKLTPTITGSQGDNSFVSSITEDEFGHVEKITYKDVIIPDVVIKDGSNVKSGAVSGDNYITGITASGHEITVTGSELPGKVKVDSTGSADYLINQIVPKATLGTDEYAVTLAKNASTGKIEASVIINRIDGGTF